MPHYDATANANTIHEQVYFFSGVCKTRTGYLRMADADGGCGWENADGKMRMEKNAGNKKSKKEKTRSADGKKNK